MILDGRAEMRLLDQYRAVRARTLELASPLSPEDQGVQSMPDASPTKWHLAHTTWFFETFVLKPHAPDHRPFDPAFEFLFNSYYEGVGPRPDRARRGELSRPSLAEVQTYRRHVDQAIGRLLEGGSAAPAVASTITLGLHHEQQHQELLLTDIKHAFGSHPLQPAYRTGDDNSGMSPADAVIAMNLAEQTRQALVTLTAREEKALRMRFSMGEKSDHPVKEVGQDFQSFEGGVVWIGHEGGGFAFDNEGPRHRSFLDPFAIARRPVSCGDYLAFMRDGGYARPELWLSEGWRLVESERWRAPLYWQKAEEAQEANDRDAAPGWLIYTLAGRRAVDANEVVAHVSYYEADAYARWAGARLVTEEEWEHASASAAVSGQFADSGRLHPAAAAPGMFGDVWQWTRSPYGGYPGYRVPDGPIGEYNGKFMSNQMVLRGGSCLTPADHVRATYRNFFPPATRWQMSGIRLGRDL